MLEWPTIVTMLSLRAGPRDLDPVCKDSGFTSHSPVFTKVIVIAVVGL